MSHSVTSISSLFTEATISDTVFNGKIYLPTTAVFTVIGEVDIFQEIIILLHAFYAFRFIILL